MRVAWFSPLPPVRSGIAAYSAELLAQLASIDASSDRSVPRARGSTRTTSSGEQRDAVRPCRLPARERAVPRLHVGVSGALPGPRRAARRAAAPRARAQLLAAASASTTTATNSATTIRTQTADFVEYAVEGLGGPIYYFWPMLRRGDGHGAGRSPCTTRASPRSCARRFPGTAHVDTIRMGVPPSTPTPDAPTREVRRQLRLPDDAVVFAAFGKVTAEKRISADPARARRARRAKAPRLPDARW